MEYGTLGFNVVAAVIKILFMILGFLMPLASILTWLERRQSAMMQDRLGPNRANIGPVKLFGITHFLADALKFMGKEDYVPGKAHKFLFMWAPIMAMSPALIVAAIIPFGPPLCWGELLTKAPACGSPVGLQIARLDIGLLFYFAISSLAVYGATLAGWASHNKWAMMGGLRATSQMMSYEVTMGMAVLGAFLVYGTLEPGAIADMQTHILSFGHFASSWGSSPSPPASSSSSPPPSRRPSGRRSTSPRVSRRSSATSSSTPGCGSVSSSWASSWRSSPPAPS